VSCSGGGGTPDPNDARTVELGASKDSGGSDAPAFCGKQVFKNEVTNARDLGGHPLASGGAVACGKLLRGGDLGSLSSTGCDEFSKLGIKTVVDLRQTSVQSSQPPASCVPSQAKLVNAAMPKLLPDTPENYLALMNEKAAITAMFRALGEAASYPVYIHCVIGRDRASFMTALVLLALGADRQTVVSEFQLSEQAGVTVKPECIEAMLDEIENQGGIEAYLTSVGVTSEQLTALRQTAKQ
jgi:protein tyrosine/serine phosphatase